MTMTALSDRLDQLDIDIKSTHMGLRAQENNDNYLMDEWECIIRCNDEGDKLTRSLTTSYKSGIGHRKNVPYVKREGASTWRDTKTHAILATSAEDAARKGYTTQVAPKLADVLHCLLSDASSVDGETFIDWASNYGLNADSRQGLDTYLACQKTLVDLRRMLGYELYNELRQLEH